jgi:uncharacterized protein involved in oxidation of intracellular sulfur
MRALSDEHAQPDSNDPAVNILVIVNNQPYGSERPCNAVRLANGLSKRERVDVRVFLIGDGVACAISGQALPEGTTTSTACSRVSYLAPMWVAAAPASTRVASARAALQRARRSTLEELTEWTLWADKALVF